MDLTQASVLLIVVGFSCVAILPIGIIALKYEKSYPQLPRFFSWLTPAMAIFASAFLLMGMIILPLVDASSK